jgi:hypothetical protein
MDFMMLGGLRRAPEDDDALDYPPLRRPGALLMGRKAPSLVRPCCRDRLSALESEAVSFRLAKLHALATKARARLRRVVNAVFMVDSCVHQGSGRPLMQRCGRLAEALDTRGR